MPTLGKNNWDGTHLSQEIPKQRPLNETSNFGNYNRSVFKIKNFFKCLCKQSLRTILSKYSRNNLSSSFPTVPHLGFPTVWSSTSHSSQKPSNLHIQPTIQVLWIPSLNPSCIDALPFISIVVHDSRPPSSLPSLKYCPQSLLPIPSPFYTLSEHPQMQSRGFFRLRLFLNVFSPFIAMAFIGPTE